jgi:hypothetical protein
VFFLSHISILQVIDQAMVAFGEDLQNWLSVYLSENGIFSLVDFSPFELTFLDSNVIFICLETFSHH